MCGRVIQSSGPLRYGIVEGMDMRDSRTHNYPPKWNAAPSLLVIRRNHETGQVSLDPLRWGLIPYWCRDPKGGRKPINAKSETVHANELVAEIHDRMPLILARGNYTRWLSDEPDPRGLMRPFPAEPMRDVADFDAGQQAGKRRPVQRRTDRIGHCCRVVRPKSPRRAKQPSQRLLGRLVGSRNCVWKARI